MNHTFDANTECDLRGEATLAALRSELHEHCARMYPDLGLPVGRCAETALEIAYRTEPNTRTELTRRAGTIARAMVQVVASATGGIAHDLNLARGHGIEARAFQTLYRDRLDLAVAALEAIAADEQPARAIARQALEDLPRLD